MDVCEFGIGADHQYCTPADVGFVPANPYLSGCYFLRKRQRRFIAPQLPSGPIIPRELRPGTRSPRGSYPVVKS